EDAGTGGTVAAPAGFRGGTARAGGGAAGLERGIAPAERHLARAEAHAGSTAGGDRREGAGTGARQPVQERVPRQHVARAAHAAEQPADPLAQPGGEPG